jgi:hypothetical protein
VACAAERGGVAHRRVTQAGRKQRARVAAVPLVGGAVEDAELVRRDKREPSSRRVPRVRHVPAEHQIVGARRARRCRSHVVRRRERVELDRHREAVAVHQGDRRTGGGCSLGGARGRLTAAAAAGRAERRRLPASRGPQKQLGGKLRGAVVLRRGPLRHLREQPTCALEDQ